ncbi:MAG: Dps family protein [Pseudomonadota bacterium]
MTKLHTQTAAQSHNVSNGVEREDRQALSALLGKALASTYVLYHKTHAFHWNVIGPMFYSIHQLTDAQYKDLAGAIDDIAERIRAIGFRTPTGLSRYVKESCVADETDVHDAAAMVEQLASDHLAVAVQLRDAVKEAETRDDVYTADLLTARIGVHEEAAWMLRALIAQ